MRNAFHLAIPLLVAVPSVLAAQDTGAGDVELIRNALTAAPASIADGATVLAGGTVLRQGTNGWICFPDNPDTPNDSPMCSDAMWMEMFDALANRRAPVITRVGVSYMLQGASPTSNTDPFATGPTADNEWMEDGPPHIMFVFPDNAVLEGISADPDNGGPWVLWRDTPYAVLIVPSTAPAGR